MAPPARASMLRVAARTAGVTLAAAAAVATAAALPLAVRQEAETAAGVPLATTSVAPPAPPSVGRNTIFPLAVTLDGAPNGNYTVPVDVCIRTLSAAFTGTAVDEWALTTLREPVTTAAGRTRYSTRYTAALPTAPAGEGDVALRYARWLGRGGLDGAAADEPACNGTDLSVRLQTAEGAGVEPATDPIPPSVDAADTVAVGAIVVAGPGGPQAPPVATTTTAPVTPPVIVPPPAVTTPVPSDTPTPEPEPTEEPDTVVPPIIVPPPVDPTDPEETAEPVVEAAAEAEEGEEDDGGSNLVPILVGCAVGAAVLALLAFALLITIRTGEPPVAPAAASASRGLPPPPPPPVEAAAVPAASEAALVGGDAGATGGDVAGAGLAGAAAGAGALAAVPLVAGAAENPHDYQIGAGPVAPASPPPPAGYLAADDAAEGDVGFPTPADGMRGVEGVEGATGVPYVPVVPAGEGEQFSLAGAALPAAAAGAAAGAVAAPVLAAKDASSSSDEGAPAAAAAATDSNDPVDADAPAPAIPAAPVKESFVPYQQPPQSLDKPILGAYAGKTDDFEAPSPPPPPPLDAYGVPSEDVGAPAFPAADPYGEGVEEPASFGGKMMGGLTAGLASARDTGRDALDGGYEAVTGSTAEPAAERDMGMPVLDSPEFSDLRGTPDAYGRR